MTREKDYQIYVVYIIYKYYFFRIITKRRHVIFNLTLTLSSYVLFCFVSITSRLHRWIKNHHSVS